MWQWAKALWRNLARKQSVEADLDAEVRSFQNILEDQKAQSGMDRRAAAREAMLELGGVEQVKEEVRDVRVGAALDALVTDVRQALRGLRRNPGLTAAGAATLALGMAASIVVFSIFQAALLRPLPFRDPSRLVDLSETRLDRGTDRAAFTEATFWDVRNQNHTFSDVAAFHYDEANLTGAGPAEKVTLREVTANFFPTLGVSPVLGRNFREDEARNGFSNHTALLGYRFWKTRFGGDPNILGKTLHLNADAYTIIGVLPQGEPWLNDQVYVPFGYRADADRGSWEFSVVGRIAPGVSNQRVNSDLQRVATGIARAFPRECKGLGFRIDSSHAWVASDTMRQALWVLLGAVAFLMLIACVNMANLLLARGTARQREIAVRTALGAGRLRLVRFVMMESLLLSGFGAALGLALAYVVLRATPSLAISGVPRIEDANLNPWVLAFTLVMALLTGVLAGLAPAFQAPAQGVSAALREGDHQTGSRRQGRLRAGLVTLEVSLSFLLLVGSGLLIRSFNQLTSVNIGFQTEHRLLFAISFPGSYYEKGVGKQFMDRFLDRLSAMPDVVCAGVVSSRPMGDNNPGMGFDSVAHSRTAGGVIPWAAWRIVTPGYLRAVGLPLVRGRVFTPSDPPVWGLRGQPEPTRHVMISDALARRVFGSSDPIGQHVVLWKGQGNLDADVVGVVRDNRERGLSADPSLTVYLPYGSNALASDFVIHTRGNPVALARAVRSLVSEMDPNLPVTDMRPFADEVSLSVAPERFRVVLVAVFGGLALLLATIGIYGVVSYSMSRRTSEIGLRVALGASGANILRMTMVQGIRPALVGIAVGAAAAWWLSRYIASLLFGVKPFDVVTYACVALLLLATAALACYLPGRRAMRTDPVTALRAE